MTHVECAFERVVPDIGQISPADKKALDKLVKRGELDKWRGCWHPVAGAPFGIGPLKTCYGPIGSKYYFTRMHRCVTK